MKRRSSRLLFCDATELEAGESIGSNWRCTCRRRRCGAAACASPAVAAVAVRQPHAPRQRNHLITTDTWRILGAREGPPHRSSLSVQSRSASKTCTREQTRSASHAQLCDGRIDVWRGRARALTWSSTYEHACIAVQGVLPNSWFQIPRQSNPVPHWAKFEAPRVC